MFRSTRHQLEKVLQFCGVTGASEKIANDCLKRANWSVEAAIDYYYVSGLQSSVIPKVDTKAISALFDSYKDPDDDVISGEGIMKFCSDVGVDPADSAVLVIAFYMNVEAMGEFKRGEFVDGLSKIGVDSTEKLKRKIPELRDELKREDRFRDIYMYAYSFSREKGQKCVHLDVAIPMWQLLLGNGRWNLVDKWCDFLLKHHNKAISRDTWQQLYEFMKVVKPDFSNYESESSAWPYLIDEFVEHCQSDSL